MFEPFGGRSFNPGDRSYFFFSETERKGQTHSTWCEVGGKTKEYSQMVPDSAFYDGYTLQDFIRNYMKRFPDGVFLGAGEFVRSEKKSDV